VPFSTNRAEIVERLRGLRITRSTGVPLPLGSLASIS